MAITKLKCPTCQGPAIAVSERSIAGMRSVMYKCGPILWGSINIDTAPLRQAHVIYGDSLLAC